YTCSRSSLRATRYGACCRRAWRAGSMVRHAPIHRRSGHSDIAICCGRNVRGSSPSTSVVPLSNQVTTLNHKRFKGFKMFSDGHLGFLILFENPDVGAWRWMYASTIVLAIPVLIGRFFIVQSPLWLMFRGRIEEARAATERLLRRDPPYPKEVVLQHPGAPGSDHTDKAS